MNGWQVPPPPSVGNWPNVRKRAAEKVKTDLVELARSRTHQRVGEGQVVCRCRYRPPDTTLSELSGSPKLSQPAVNFCVVVAAEAVMTTVSTANASQSVLLMLFPFVDPDLESTEFLQNSRTMSVRVLKLLVVPDGRPT